MKKRKPNPAIGISECARRTGLTVRALRVYERLGLIKPSRSASGYRFYTRRDLVRLNAIVALKGLGLSLAQIRDVFSGSSPQLRKVLRMQLEVWESRRAAADKGIGLVRAALAGLDARARLSISDLCHLARSMDVKNLQQMTREVINESISADEERAWATWWAGQPQAKIQALQQYSAVQRALMAELAKLHAAGAAPASNEVQNLVLQWVVNLDRYGAREVILEAIDWNMMLTRKLLRVGERITTHAVDSRVRADGADVWKFLRSAWKVSLMGREQEALLSEARSLVQAGTLPATHQGGALAKRLRDLCQRYQLGDPSSYARWSCGMGTPADTGEHVDLQPVDAAAWKYLTDACRGNN